MNQVFTIGALSKKVGLPVKTIRFYEEAGLIDSPKRAENGYRIYDDNSFDQLRVIKYAREMGLSIEQIKKLIKGCGDGKCEHSSEYLELEISSYLSLLNEKIGRLNTLKNKLSFMKKNISKCSKDSKYCCNILGQISQVWEGGEAK